MKQYFREYYLKNRDRILARSNAYNKNHLFEKRERDRRYYNYKKKEGVPIKIESGIKISFS